MFCSGYCRALIRILQGFVQNTVGLVCSVHIAWFGQDIEWFGQDIAGFGQDIYVIAELLAKKHGTNTLMFQIKKSHDTSKSA